MPCASFAHQARRPMTGKAACRRLASRSSASAPSTRPSSRSCSPNGTKSSIAGPVTYPNAKDLRETLRYIPLENLLIETDCPLLAPQSKRGTRNEPAYVAYTAAEIAAERELPVDEVRVATTANAARLFGFGL